MTSEKIHRQFGLWSSPITPRSLARGMGFSDVAWSQDGSLVWLESRPERSALVVQPPDGQAWRDLNSEFSVRSKVGYGGGEFGLGREGLADEGLADGAVYFVDSSSGRIFRQPLAGGQARPVTPAFGQAASPTPSPDGRWLLFVHSYEDQDVLAIVDADGEGWPQKLAAGDDFYMQPAWHPDSQRAAWVAWNHPNMPWDGAFLRVGRLRIRPAGLPVLDHVATIAGDEKTAVFQPEFSPDGGSLAYVSNSSGWWQIYLYDLATGQHRQLTTEPAEHGAPAWIQGMRTYAFAPDGKRLYFLRNQAGSISLWRLDLDTAKEERLALSDIYTDLEQISLSPDGRQIALLASGSATPGRVISVQVDDGLAGGEARIWRRSAAEELPSSAYSIPQAIEWQGMDGGRVYGLYYPPKNDRFEGTGQPPLIVNVHGGPTGQVRTGFNAEAQFFTSRGYAVLEVNYRGSTGYGRSYQDALRGNWGIYDVQDPVSGARSLVERGWVDGRRMAIMGGSAGGFSVLKALEDYPGFFKAGICRYGISNHFTLVAEMPKFEAHYSDSLIGPLPEAADLYRERSPIFFAGKVQDPIALFQGEDDPVVPRKQSDDFVEALKQRGVPFIYRVYPGEGHGFRKAETIEDYYRTVEDFLRQQVLLT